MGLFLVISLMLPGVSVDAETFPVEAFEGTWEWEKDNRINYDNSYTDMRFDNTFVIDENEVSCTYKLFDITHENLDGKEWGYSQNCIREIDSVVTASGSYTYDEETGILTANVSGIRADTVNSQAVGANNGTTETPFSATVRLSLKNINELLCVDENGNAEKNVYKRTSETPVFEPEEPEEEEIEEPEEVEEEEIEEPKEEPEETEEDLEGPDVEEEEDEEEPEEVDKDFDRFMDDFYKYYFNVDDVHLDKMKTAAADAGISMMALAFAFASAGSAGFGGFGGAGALGGGFPGGPGSVEGGFSGGEYPGQNPDVPTENLYGNDFGPEETSLEKEARRLEKENREWMQKQREANNRLSHEAKDWSAQKEADEKAWQREQKKNELFYKHGNWDNDYNKYKKDWIKERMNEAEVSGKLLQRAEYMDASAKTAENVKKGCDIAIDICAELEPTGTGKQIKNIYKASAEFAGQLGEVTAGKQKIGQALAKTVYNTSIEYIKDNLDDEGFGGQVKKFFANTECEAWKGYVNAAIDGKSHEKCLEKAREGYKDGFKSWAIDTAIGTVAKTVTKGADLTDLTGYKINGIYRMKDIKGDDFFYF